MYIRILVPLDGAHFADQSHVREERLLRIAASMSHEAPEYPHSVTASLANVGLNVSATGQWGTAAYSAVRQADGES
jgi:hypothetical protein